VLLLLLLLLLLLTAISHITLVTCDAADKICLYL